MARDYSKAIRSDDWKLSINENFEDTLLFNIAKDPFETKNVQANRREIVQELKLVHVRWSQTLPAPRWPSMIYYEYHDGEKIHYFDQ